MNHLRRMQRSKYLAPFVSSTAKFRNGILVSLCKIPRVAKIAHVFHRQERNLWSSNTSSFGHIRNRDEAGFAMTFARCKISSTRMLSTLTNYNENDGNSEDKSKKIPRWPWIMAAITGLATLYVSSSAQMDNLYRYAVEEISRDQQILQGLQVVLSFCNF
jgi:hypothetical protein